MRFQTAHPEWLWLLAALPLWALRAAIGRARRGRGWSALGQVGRPSGDGAYLWLASAVCLVLALVQPRWGRSGRPPLPPGHDVVLAVDVSRSMAAVDAVPDRLGVAVEAARSFLAALGREPGERAAVVAFAGRGALRCPLTANLGAAGETLGELKAGTVRPGGTDLGAALDAALDAFDDLDRAGGRSVVLFSDGEDHDGRWASSLSKARDQGVIVHAVAVGDAKAGHQVPGPGGAPVEFDGKPVLSKRADEALEVIARSSGGAFVPLGLATTDLGRLYRTRIEPAASARRTSVAAPEPGERFGLFLMAAFGFGVAAGWAGRPRLSAPRRRGWAWGRALAITGLAAAGAGPGIDRDPAAAIEAGRSAYASGRFEAALARFRRAAALDPSSAEARYDAGAALFRLGRFAEARVLYGEARERAGAPLRAKTDFALGNSALLAGDLPGAIAHYDACLASAAEAPGADLDRVRADAAANRRFAEEQARRALAPPDDGQGSNEPPDRPRDRNPGPGDGPERPEDRGPGAGDRNPDGTPPPGEPPGGRRRGAGGAGGSGTEPPPPGSPEDQLARAVDHVREARRRRISESDVPDKTDNRKDW